MSNNFTVRYFPYISIYLNKRHARHTACMGPLWTYLWCGVYVEGGGVLPYRSYIGMCHCGVGFFSSLV